MFISNFINRENKMISKELFIKCLDAIEAQHMLEQENSKTLSDVFGCSDVKFENSLYKPLIELLQVWFPKDKDDFCEIEHFCFELNFGRQTEIVVTSAEELYDKLILNRPDIFESAEYWELVKSNDVKKVQPFAHPLSD